MTGYMIRKMLDQMLGTQRHIQNPVNRLPKMERFATIINGF